MTLDEERKAKLIAENEWLPKAIEVLSLRLIDKGFNVHNKWLGYYDTYVLHYIPRKYWNDEYEDFEIMDWGTLEVHSKTKVFNPYKFCGGEGNEYEKLSEMEMTTERWKIIEEYIRWDDLQVCGKKVDLLSDPYYERPRFIGGSDVPINGYYE